LVLDAISSGKPNASLALLFAMLSEYGHFLGNVLSEKTDQSVSSPKLAGRAFAYQFMECSDANLFVSDFEFADFIASDAKEKEHKLTAKISGLSHEQRKVIFYSLGSESIWEGES